MQGPCEGTLAPHGLEGVLDKFRIYQRMSNRVAFWRRVALVNFLIILMLLVTASYAKAHSWYPHECCSDRDCEAIPPETVQVTPSGYLWAGMLIPFDQARVSLDNDYHVCRGVYTGILIQPSQQAPCFFAPARGT